MELIRVKLIDNRYFFIKELLKYIYIWVFRFDNFMVEYLSVTEKTRMIIMKLKEIDECDYIIYV